MQQREVDSYGDDDTIALITADLNPPQLDAVTAEPGNMLVLAGAGSGKTRVLVHRIAYLVAKYGLSPYSLLAVTFTNKAAGEMRERAVRLLNIDNRALWIGTFHGISHRVLRMHWRDANLPQNFEIIDASDQRRVVKRILNERRWQAEDSEVREYINFINRSKDEGRRSDQIFSPRSRRESDSLEIYKAYEKTCFEKSLVDFGELLLRCVELLLENAELLEHYKKRFSHILVDEFQDTNTIQYAWLKLLSGQNEPSGQSIAVTVVGDDDQSIYGWRGAQVGNIHRFETEFPGTQVIRLEQNYRSTSTILGAANDLIKHNYDRLGKTLWTDADEGEKITVFNAYNERDEADYVVNTTEELDSSGIADSLSDFAILYRTNAQSRVLEDELVKRRMAYQVYGGQRFYDRLEIRNALAYMRLISDRHADVAMERVINVPPRRIGGVTLDRIRQIAASHELSLWDAIVEGIRTEAFSNAMSVNLGNFVSLIEQLADSCRGKSLAEIGFSCVYDSGLMDFHGSERGEVGITRKENLEELVNACRQFKVTEPRDGEEQKEVYPGLANFLNGAVLDSGEHQSVADPSVKLMTLHSAKGLEFPVVFITGWEKGLFPSGNSYENPDAIQEERRLAYVGITRSMKLLYLTYASSRMQWGRTQTRAPSPFLEEMPPKYLKIVRPAHSRGLIGSPPGRRRKQPDWRPNNGAEEDTEGTPYDIGQRVHHDSFGEGTVVAARNPGPRAFIQIGFDDGTARWLLATTKQLSKLD